MKRTGELLRKAREDKGLSVHEVGLFLKINPRILQAIEEGDQSQLPAKTFLRGFVQSYAKFLKLNSQDVLQIFTEEMSPSAPVKTEDVSTASVKSAASLDDSDVSSVQEPQPAPGVVEKAIENNVEDDALKNSILTKASGQNDALRVKTFAISIIGLVLVFVIYFVNSVIKKYQREAELAPEVAASTETSTAEQAPTEENPDPASPGVEKDEAVPPANVNTAPEAVTAASSNTSANSPSTSTTAPHANQEKQTPVKPSPVAPTTATPAPTAETKPSPPHAPTAAATTPAKPTAPAPAAPATTTKPVTTPTPSTPPPAATTKPNPSTTTTITPTPAAAQNPTAATATTAKPVEGKLTEVIVEATQNVEIEYSSAKSSPQKLVLKADQIHTFKSRSGVRLKISNAGAVNIIVNGQDLGAPGATGQSIQVSYE